ncbi:MAG TPA: ATP-binding protein [Smithellaceae bacterium]|nr:ATP-binding protein [Smithellaceae bacterium]
MDSFTLAAASFIIAISLIITGRKDKLLTSFVALCAAVFLSQTGIFFQSIFAAGFWKTIEYLGMLAIAPLTLWFTRQLTQKKTFISRGLVFFFVFLSIIGGISLFTALPRWPYFEEALLIYVYCLLGLSYLALLIYIKKLPPSTEKKRLGYLIYVCPLAALLSSFDVLSYFGFSFPAVSGLIIAALLYFLLLIIAYPQLHEFHDFLARALIIMVSTLAGTIIFYLVAVFFSDGPLPSFTIVVMASLLIVISLSPLKMILKKIFSFFYPASQDVFTSLYEFDEKLEREKTLLLAEMAPVLAHEIRNPLGSIKGAAQYLEGEAVSEEHKKLLNVIIEEVNRLNSVVNKFLNYARPQKLNIRLQSVNPIIEKAISIIAVNHLTSVLKIEKELHDDIPLVDIDEEQMIQVILNIALNAIEAMPQGGSLTFRTARIESNAGRAVGITIRDTGQGMNDEQIKNIFKPFYTTKERGVGLGLAICRKIIKEHGGMIRVKSIPSQGTVFFIRFNASG